LTHSDVVDEVEVSHGQANKIYDCPHCSSSLLLREGEMAVVGDRRSVLLEESVSTSSTLSEAHICSDQRDEGELVIC